MLSILRKLGVKFSLNDPEWGRGSSNGNRQNNNDQNGNKKPSDGPPELDQMWRDFNQRINQLLGKKNGGNGGNPGNNGKSYTPNGKSSRIGAGLIAIIAVFLWLASGFFIVQEGQTGVVMTFGKYSYTAVPGFNWRWPYPIQSTEIVNVSQVRTVEVGYRTTAKNKQLKEALMLTDDENIIDIQFAVQYRLKDASQWLFNNKDQDEMVRHVAETAIREIVGKSKMDFVLYEGREKVALDVAQSMQRILDHYQAGVQITNVTMQGVQPPEQVQAAFDDAVKAGQDRERLKNEGQAYANDVIPKARGAASRLLEEANAYRESVVATAEGDASRFKQVLEEYRKAPAVTRDRMYIETMQKIFESTTKVMIDAKSGSNLLYLPLDKLIAQTGSGAPDASKPTVPATGASSIVAPAANGNTFNNIQQDNPVRDARGREGR
jgi:membrane protease subunit HflK